MTEMRVKPIQNTGIPWLAARLRSGLRERSIRDSATAIGRAHDFDSGFGIPGFAAWRLSHPSKAASGCSGADGSGQPTAEADLRRLRRRQMAVTFCPGFAETIRTLVRRPGASGRRSIVVW
jgi:hypothetical protein